MLRRLFALGRKSRPRHALDDIEVLEKTARLLPAEQRGGVLYHTADLYTQASQPARALAAYDQAIDAYLECGRLHAASTVCRRLMEVHPDVVRARGTLAFLDLGERLRAAAAAQAVAGADALLDDYVRASRAARRDGVASRHLQLLARETGSYEVQERISDLLLALGDHAGAEEVFLTAYEERHGLRTPRALRGAQTERWVRVLRLPLAEHPAPVPDEPSPTPPE